MHPRATAIAALIIPCAAILTVAGPAAAADTTCSNLWCQSSDSWRKSGFGSSYSLWTGIETKQDHESDSTYDADYLKAGVDFSATAKILGDRETIADIEALAVNDGSSASGDILVSVLGTTIVSAGMSNTVDYGWSRNFFDASEDISLLGMSVHVHGKVTGDLGVDVTPSIQSGSIVLAAEPYLAASADADASVGVAGASVGVDGSLTALDLDTPLSASATIGAGNKLAYAVKGTYSLHTLDGKLKVYAHLHDVGTDSKTLADFNGYSASGTYLDISGSLSL